MPAAGARLIRTAQLTNKEVSSRIGCSASYLSRILSGERQLTWKLIRKFTQIGGADPEAPRTVWESEKVTSTDVMYGGSSRSSLVG